MQGTLMQQGGELMLFGMGTVFVFLSLLVVLTTIMSRLLQRYVKPELAAVAQSRMPAQDGGEGSQQGTQLVAVISAAIHQHRSKQKD